MITAALAWYDENPDLLSAAIASAAQAGAASLVAVDGAYAHFPEAKPTSPDEQLAAIVKTCRVHGVDLCLYQPTAPWPTEAAKRSTLFALCDAAAPDAWVFVMDADYQIRVDRGSDLVDLLAAAAADGYPAAEATLWTIPGERSLAWQVPEWSRIRCFFRGPAITVGPTNHYTYTRADGLVLWGHDEDELAPAADLSSVVRVDHMTFHRGERTDRQAAYYNARDAAGIERGPCGRCKREKSVAWMPTGIRKVGDDGDFDADWLEVCPSCVRDVASENTRQAVLLGIDANRVNRPLAAVRGALDPVRDAD